ncbi:hypothetical protein [Microbacterium binotii]|uniref:Uncharacterized protein n=1 Tax=Microbacterium binotii TaxID=462710 RepID=A0ABN3PCY3_9MICO
MTPEQEAAYWRDQSKTQQRKAETAERSLTQWTALGDFDAVSGTVTKAAQAAIDALPAEQQAVATATAAGEAAGFARAQQTYVRPAVQAILVARTKAADESTDDANERIKAVLDVLDVTKFVGADGELDTAKVDAFAGSLAPKDSTGNGPQADPLGAFLHRQHTTPPGSGGSIADMEKQHYDRLTGNK